MIEIHDEILRERITTLSKELNSLIESGQDILSPKILDISTKLDEYIVKYYKMKLGSMKNKSKNRIS